MKNQTVNFNKVIKYGLFAVVAYFVFTLVFPIIISGLTYIMLAVMWVGEKIVNWIMHGKKKRYELIVEDEGVEKVIGYYWK